MDIDAFSDKFDVLLNSYNNPSLFGDGDSIYDITVDEYEKSVHLTHAVKQFVVDYYSGTNPLNLSFEEKERMREALDVLVRTVKYDSAGLSSSEEEDYDPIEVPDNTFLSTFPKPSNLLFIIFEEVKFSDYLCGVNQRKAVVIPATHDDLWYRLQNPFRGPSNGRVLRVNASNCIELISNHPIGSYVLRYLKQPEPIILTDLPNGLTIDGKNKKSVKCELREITHDAILEIAVRLAIQAKSIGKRTGEESQSTTTKK